MPITAKLSRKFYYKLGDDVANELLECSIAWTRRTGWICES